MDRFTFVQNIGEGSYGRVCRATNEGGEVVAIKRLKKKYSSWEECLNLREVKILTKMNHPNIVKLKQVIREHDILYFVFENMDCNLYEVMKKRGKPFSEPEIRDYCFQIFNGLALMHEEQGYFHRDMKLENLLVTKDVIKIADFGLAQESYSKTPFTPHVTTRWYRAPEILLSSPVYDPAVDMWAMGAIMAELFTFTPLFRGTNEANQICRICDIIGTPTQSTWKEGLILAKKLNYQFPEMNGVDLSFLLSPASMDAVNLISSLCSWDPRKRPTAMAALQHPFFKASYPSPRLKTPLTEIVHGGCITSSRIHDYGGAKNDLEIETHDLENNVILKGYSTQVPEKKHPTRYI